jgi:hypothetical protein
VAEHGRLTTVVVDSDQASLDCIAGLAATVPEVEVVGTAIDEAAVHALVVRYQPAVLVVGRWVVADPRSAGGGPASEPPLISGLEVANRMRYMRPGVVVVLCAPGDELRIAARNVGVGL